MEEKMSYDTGKKEKIRRFLSENASRAYTLEQICLAVLENGRGKSTVYRLVSDMVAEEEVRRLSDGRTRHCTYQYIGGDTCRSHLHFKCRSCGRVMHLDEKTTADIKASLELAGGFRLDIGELIYGKCGGCAYTGVNI